jgi:predicted lipoprotein
MDDQTVQLINSLRANPSAVQALFRSADGRRLLTLLTQQDQGAALRQAAQSAAQGDSAQMLRLVSGILRSPEGAELAERISSSIRK